MKPGNPSPPPTASPPLARRRFLKTLTAGSACALFRGRGSDAIEPRRQARVRGLLLGSFIGDALGGPIEFQDPDRVQGLPEPPKRWRNGETPDAVGRAAAADRLRLRSYRELRPEPEPYAHWEPNAAAGTVTDDTRHKLILLHALRSADPADDLLLGRHHFARAHLEWPQIAPVQSRPDYRELCREWLREWEQGARWVLGERKPAHALPPERMWAGLPTCCGQMSLLPLAALLPGRPEAAYRLAYELGFFDNGFGKDLNAALVAGLSTALVQPVGSDNAAEAWEAVFTAMRATDPYAYGKVPWVQRPVDRWLDRALDLAEQAAGEPAAAFASLETEFASTIKWEAQVPFVVAFTCLRLARYHPLAALELTLEWGHDTDSYAALLGAFVGALHGAELFPDALRKPVEERLAADYGFSVEEAVSLLLQRNQP